MPGRLAYSPPPPLVTDCTFPCPICEKPNPVKVDKRGKPYVVCARCKAQFFVRGELGIRDLLERLEAVWPLVVAWAP